MNSVTSEQTRSRPLGAPDFITRKEQGIPISMVTCYDYWSAVLIEKAGIDSILVGDSGAMVMHGHSSTLPATVAMMAEHTAAVRRGAPEAFIIADVPFLCEVGSPDKVIENVRPLMQAGANAVKLEGAVDGPGGNLPAVSLLVRSGVPVMGHIGLTPQSVNALGGYRVQGREEAARASLFSAAHKLQEAGCFALVAECVPEEAGAELSKQLRIPVIGIGAGVNVDGQVLVLHDLLGLSPGRKPRFVRTYLEGARVITDALKAYHEDVRAKTFPGSQESYR